MEPYENNLFTKPPADGDDTHTRILNTAARIFAEKGYARATTKQIAEESGFTEMTLFRHFKSKKNLFAAVLEQFAVPDHFEELLLKKLIGSYREDMDLLSRYLMDILITRRESMKMMLCESGHFPEMQDVLGQVPRRLRNAVAGYLSKKIKSGDVKARDPDILAQTFIGFFFSYSIAIGFLPSQMSLDMEKEQVRKEFIEFFVEATVQNKRETE